MVERIGAFRKTSVSVKRLVESVRNPIRPLDRV